MRKADYVVKLRLTRTEKAQGKAPTVIIARADSGEHVLTLHEPPVQEPQVIASKTIATWQAGPFANHVLRLLNSQWPETLREEELGELRQSMRRVQEMNRSVATSLARTAQLLKVAIEEAMPQGEESGTIMGEIEQELDGIIAALKSVIGDVTERTEEVAAELA